MSEHMQLLAVAATAFLALSRTTATETRRFWIGLDLLVRTIAVTASIGYSLVFTIELIR